MSESVLRALLQHSHPSVGTLAARELEVQGTQSRVDPLASPRGAALLEGVGELPGDPCRKWTGAHWRLLALTELGVSTVPDTLVPLVEEVSGRLARSLRREPAANSDADAIAAFTPKEDRPAAARPS